MAYEVQKLVLFRRERHPLAFDQLVATVRGAEAIVRVSGAFAYVSDDDDTTAPAVRISIAHGPDVLAESKAIAERHAGDRVDRSQIAACDARIEIAWKPDEWDDVVDIVVAMEPELEALVRGVTWTSNLKELSDGSLQ